MPRELWKGAITFGLVHIPVSLYPAEERQELSFTMLDRRDLQPVGYKRYNKTTGEEVPFDQVVKGYEWEEGSYVTLEKEDFATANVEATQTVDIVGFVDKVQVPPYFYEAPYYLGPGKHGDKGYALLRETLIRTGKVGIANVVIRTRAHVAAVYAVESHLVMNTLRFATELRDPSEIKVPGDLQAAKVTAREIDMAERLVEDMEIEFDARQFRDTYRDDLLKLIEDKAKGRVRAEPRARKAREAEVIDFASLLEKSLSGRKRADGGRRAANDEAEAPKRKPATTRARRKGARAATQRKAA